MIAWIEGRLLASWGNNCIVATSAGIGYQLALPAHTFANLPPLGEKAAFYTALVTREDAQELFGFATLEERQTFEILRAINRIGPRTALAILSQLRPDELAQAVAEENQAAFAKISGIGPKTAQHLLLELRYKIKNREISPAAPATARSGLADVLTAMANLGYEEDECGVIAREIYRAEPDIDVASAIRKTLAALRLKTAKESGES